MSKIVQAAVAAALIFSSLAANAQYTPYKRGKTREVLQNLSDNPPTSTIEFVGKPVSARAEAFLKFYQERIHPHDEYMSNLSMRYVTLRLLRDSGSYLNKAEKDQWTKTSDALDEENNEASVDEKWTETLREWAHLSEGLTGHLPDLARRKFRNRELESFPPEMKASLDEIAVLEREYEDVTRETQAAKRLREFRTQMIEARRSFKTGKISFAEGRKINAKIFSEMGDHFVGAEAAATAGENLNRIAIVRTQLAKFKGFASHADYVLAMTGDGYIPGYRGSANQRNFIKDYLTALMPVQKAFIELRLKALGVADQASGMNQQEMGFLTPPGIEMLQPHFPNESISQMWGKTLLESGFTKEQLSQILLDDGFRAKKNKSEAYLMPVLGPYNQTDRIDAATLDFVPMDRTKPALKPGFVYILQSYTGAGVYELRTAFHEGGHATDKLLKFKDLPIDEAYGYVEVPSLTSEFFTKDPEVLAALAVEVDGRKPSQEEIAAFLKNSDQTDILQVAGGLASSLFDLELWSIDYTAPGAPTFLEAVKSVSEYTDKLSKPFPNIETKVPYYFNNISTSHFTSGGVRNIGYDYAGVAAEMMATYISDELEKQTGRRSWYKQPGFAKIYGEKFVSQGWRKPFPENVEAITGRKFDYMEVVNDLARKIMGEEGCEEELRPRK